MLSKKFHIFFSVIAVFLVCINSYGKSELADSTRISDINDLEIKIKEILEETNTPAIGIALVDRSGPIWIAGFGKADIEKNIDADENSLFRIASVSKMLVALSILKLQEEGKLHLDDKVRDLVPDVKFSNRWEESNPVRVEHLLEHTTGWDEIHLVEIAHNNPLPISLQEALDFHPHSRISRWVPGSRKAYSNSGYAVAAYIVEKVSGMRYEDFVGKYFLIPLSMNHSTFYNDVVFEHYGAVAYNQKLEPLQYRNFIYRPAAATNSSPRDMSKLVQLFINRGEANFLRLISNESISRMEEQRSTPGAQGGLQLGYGLGTRASVYKGFTYYGHEGMMEGCLSELAYLPESGIGHVLFINVVNGQAFQRISNLIRDFEIQTIAIKIEPVVNEYKSRISIREGYYVPINPRNQGGLYLDYLFGAEKIVITDNKVRKSSLFPEPDQNFFSISDSAFVLEGIGKIGMVKAVDPLAGEVLYFDNLVMKRIPGMLLFPMLSSVATWVFFSLAGAMTWILFFIRSLKTGFSKTYWLLSYFNMTSVMFAIILLLTWAGYKNPDALLARPTLLSVSLMIFSVLIPVSVIFSFIKIYRYWNLDIKNYLYLPVVFLSMLQSFVCIYLIWFGVFPVITWK
ncbi:MAG TPA: serine hydrolase domain-containing protein [Cyclobacteriaceae bacterium]|nr:serine hydrolase domain-containing protein [Cyclobacteriaceae bacterium]